MDSSPLGSKPKPALPSHLLNGDSQSLTKNSPLRTSVGPKERERLAASIVSFNKPREPIQYGSLEGPNANGQQSYPSREAFKSSAASTNLSELEVEVGDPRDQAPPPTPPLSSRPASPYTSNPPIDFDGLSWPSELHFTFATYSSC